jgi:hypothetical protein
MLCDFVVNILFTAFAAETIDIALMRWVTIVSPFFPTDIHLLR